MPSSDVKAKFINDGSEVNCRLLAYRLANMPEFQRRHINVTCSGDSAFCHADGGNITVNVPDGFRGQEHTLLMYIYHEIGHVLTTNLDRKKELIHEHGGDPFVANIFNIVEDQAMEMRVRRMFPAADEHITAGNRDLFARDKLEFQTLGTRGRLNRAPEGASQSSEFVQQVTNYCLTYGYGKSDSYHYETASGVYDPLLLTMCQDWPKLKAILDPMLDRENKTWRDSELTAEQICSEIQQFLGREDRKQRKAARTARKKAADQQQGQGGEAPDSDGQEESDENERQGDAGQNAFDNARQGMKGQKMPDSAEEHTGGGVGADTENDGDDEDNPGVRLTRYVPSQAPTADTKEEDMVNAVQASARTSVNQALPSLRWVRIDESRGFHPWPRVKSDWAVSAVQALSTSMRRKFSNAVMDMTRQNLRNGSYGARLNGRVITRLGLDDLNVFRSTCLHTGIDLEVMFLVDNSSSMHMCSKQRLNGATDEMDFMDAYIQNADFITVIALAGADALKRMGIPAAIYSYDAGERLVEVMGVDLPAWSPAWHRKALLPCFGSGTPTPRALKGISSRFSGKKKRRIIVSITDGESFDQDDEARVIQQAAHAGIGILSILLNVEDSVLEKNIKMYGSRNVARLDMDKPGEVAGAIAAVIRNQIRQSL